MLAIEIQRSKRNNAPFSIIMLDLDHFKLFNDTHGHEAGDAVLQVFGSFLQRHVRGGDIACRYGGEEFTLILPGTSLEIAKQRAEQLCEELRALTVDFKKQILGPLTLSAGVASFPSHGDSGDMVLQIADQALYQAKSEGRDESSWDYDRPVPSHGQLLTMSRTLRSHDLDHWIRLLIVATASLYWNAMT